MQETWEHVKAAIIGFHRSGAGIQLINFITGVEPCEIELIINSIKPTTMAKADYAYRIEEFNGKNVMVIEDLDLGHTSVTNDMETVVSEIAAVEKLDPQDCLIVYMDTTGYWDGFDAKTNDFILVSEDNWHDAVKMVISKQLQLV